MKQAAYFALLTLLAFLFAACSERGTPTQAPVQGPEILQPDPTASPAPALTATVDGPTSLPEPAQNLEAGAETSGAEPAATATAAEIPPTIAPTPSSILGFLPEDVYLESSGLPYAWQTNLVPAIPFDDTIEPGPRGVPEHIQVNFGTVDPAQVSLGDPILFIIPAEPYKQLINDNGSPTIIERMDALASYFLERPDLAATDMPVLPFEASTAVGVGNQDFTTQGRYLQPAWGNALRFVGRFSPERIPVVNEGLYYIALGLTADGEYFISFFYPVTAPTLPDSTAEVSADELWRVNNTFFAYAQEKKAALNELPSSQWDPDLTLLDALVASLRFGSCGSE